MELITSTPVLASFCERAAKHDGFSVVEVLSECVEFFKGAFDAAVPRKGGSFVAIDETLHDVSDMSSALALAEEPWPGRFGVYYEAKVPTKNKLEKDLIERSRAKASGRSDRELLKATFDSML